MMRNVKFVFAAYVGILATIFFSSNLSAQAEDVAASPLELSIGTIRTEAEAAAVGLLVKYTEKMDEEYFFSNASDVTSSNGKGWLFDISPEVELQTGEKDSFNGLVAKLTGNYITFSTTTVSGIGTPNTAELFHVLPVSFGFESDRNFEKVNFLVEAGYVPFDLGSKWRLGLDSKIGIFLQAGYKYEVDGNASTNTGGAVDESEEDLDSGIARVKLDAGTEILKYNYSKSRTIALIPRARVWYDIVNSEIYHKLEAKLQFSLTKDKFFDLKYENGSGAPNFNEGDQFSANLTIKF